MKIIRFTLSEDLLVFCFGGLNLLIGLTVLIFQMIKRKETM